MNANDFQAAFAANISRETDLVEGQFIPATKPEQTTISGYINEGRIHGNDWNTRLGGIITASVHVEVHVVGEFDFDYLLEKGRNNYRKNLPATFLGWKVELNSNGHSDWLCKTPVYRVDDPLNEIRVARKIYGQNMAYVCSTRKINPEYVIKTFSGVNPDTDKVEW